MSTTRPGRGAAALAALVALVACGPADLPGAHVSPAAPLAASGAGQPPPPPELPAAIPSGAGLPGAAFAAAFAAVLWTWRRDP